MKTSIKALVLGALVAASAATGVLPALASTTSAAAPVRVTVTPATVLVKTGVHKFSEEIRLENTGSGAVRVSTRILELGHGATGSACALLQAPAWSSLKVLSGSGPVLKPHETRAYRFTLNAPSSLTGVKDVAAVFTSTPATGGQGATKIGGSIGSRVILRLTGSTTHAPVCGTPGHAQAASHGSGPVSVPLAIGLAALLAMGSAVILLLRRRRHNQSPTR